MAIDNHSSKRIAKNTVVLFIRMLFSMAVSLYTTRAILQILGAEDFGIYNVVGGVVVLFAFLQQTMSTTTARFITTEIGQGGKKMNQVFCMMFNLHMIVAFIILIACETIGLWLLSDKLVIPEDRYIAAYTMFHASVFSIVIGTLSVPYNATIIAYEKMSTFAVLSIVQVVLKLVIVLILPYINADRLVAFAILNILISLGIQILYWQYSIHTFDAVKFRFLWDKDIWRKVRSFAGWNTFSDLAFMCNTQGVSILLNMFFGPIVNAARGLAVQVESVANMFVGNFQTAMMPAITKTYAANELEQSRTLMKSASKFSFYLTLLIGIPLFFEIGYILQLWLVDVPEYSEELCGISILIVSVESLSRPLHYGVYATGDVKKYQMRVSGTNLMFLPIAYLLLKYCSVSPVIVMMLLFLLKVIALLLRIERVQALMSLKAMVYIKDVIIPCLSVTVCASVIPYIIVCFMEPSIIRLLISVVMDVLNFVSITYFIGLTASEKRQVIQAFEKIKQRFIKQ